MSWETAWHNLRKAAGFPNLRFHSLRHAYITMMAEVGVPRSVNRDAVEHMSEAITRHVTHISGKVARAAVEKLDQLRNSSRFVGDFVDVAQGWAQGPTSQRLN